MRRNADTGTPCQSSTPLDLVGGHALEVGEGDRKGVVLHRTENVATKRPQLQYRLAHDELLSQKRLTPTEQVRQLLFDYFCLVRWIWRLCPGGFKRRKYPRVA